MGLLLAATTADTVATPKVIAASLFKNGYAMVTREVKLTGSTTRITDLPQPVLGTLWLTGVGTKIRRMTLTTEIVKSQVPTASFDQILLANKGKTVHINSVNLGRLSGTIQNVVGEMVSLKVQNMTTVFSRNEIRSLSIEDAKLTQEVESARRVLSIDSEGPGSVQMVGLEAGLTWAPAYALDMSDPKKAKLVARATLLNDLAVLPNIEVSLVTGFPNLKFFGLVEPIVSGAHVQQFTNMLNSIGQPGGSGGFGGAGAQMMSQNMARREVVADGLAGWTPTIGAGEQLEDLFFYRMPNVNMKVGDRMLQMLFEAEADYKRVYTADLATSGAMDGNERYQPLPEGPTDVWHTLRFKNTAGRPLTTAPISVYKKGELIGQDTMTYASPNQEVSVTINKALDVRAEALEEEVAREEKARTLPNSSMIWDRVTIEGVISLTNAKSEAIEMKLTKSVVGDFESSEVEPVISKQTPGLRAVNPQTKMTWTVTLQPGEAKKFKYRYKTLLRVY